MPPAPDLEPACAGCRFWDAQEPTLGDEVAYGLCRRYPPGDNGWPATSPDDWCGEFVGGVAKLGQRRAMDSNTGQA